MKTKGVLLGVGLLLFLPLSGEKKSPFHAVQRGNVLYQAKHYEDALQQYTIAARALPEAAEIQFNQGNVFYKLYDLAKAREHYTRVLLTDDDALAGSVKYNLGNVMYQQALKAMSTAQDAITPLRAAIRYYRASLASHGPPPPARYNLELAQRFLRQLQQQQVQAPRNPDIRNQRTSPNQGQPFEQQAQQRTREQKTTLDTPQAPQDRQAPQAPQDNAPTPDNSVQTQDAPAPQELSPQEAERLVEIIRERARMAESQRQQGRRAKIRDARVDKYW